MTALRNCRWTRKSHWGVLSAHWWDPSRGAKTFTWKTNSENVAGNLALANCPNKNEYFFFLLFHFLGCICYKLVLQSLDIICHLRWACSVRWTPCCAGEFKTGVEDSLRSVTHAERWLWLERFTFARDLIFFARRDGQIKMGRGSRLWTGWLGGDGSDRRAKLEKSFEKLQLGIFLHEDWRYCLCL